ncbi:MAG: triosephosphate isomerase [Bacilli bacterium]|nr:triosephosphate isomerase [Bacilli bacterium]
MKKIIVNLKDYLGYRENVEFANQSEGLDITVFPSLPYLYIYKNKNIKIGAQDISKFEKGAHTGSVSAEHLKEFGIESVILNHRECKKDEDRLREKVRMAYRYDIDIILCIDGFVGTELEKIDGILEEIDCTDLMLAYEPTEDISLIDIVRNLNKIKDYFKKYNFKYLYGGNISSANYQEFDEALDVDGYLISSHALDPEELKRIVNQAR